MIHINTRYYIFIVSLIVLEGCKHSNVSVSKVRKSEYIHSSSCKVYKEDIPITIFQNKIDSEIYIYKNIFQKSKLCDSIVNRLTKYRIKNLNSKTLFIPSDTIKYITPAERQQAQRYADSSLIFAILGIVFLPFLIIPLVLFIISIYKGKSAKALDPEIKVPGMSISIFMIAFMLLGLLLIILLVALLASIDFNLG